MISVSSLDENINVADHGTPVLEGRWRWIETKTIQFEPKHHLLYSTKYILKVKKENCVSAIERILKEEVLYEYSTTPPYVCQFSPYGTISALKPKYFLLFDQKIDQHQI